MVERVTRRRTEPREVALPAGVGGPEARALGGHLRCFRDAATNPAVCDGHRAAACLAG
jgi:hypothetical protein